ncbi:CoA transferase [Blastococcus sp. MG754426]|uniref:CaiB/BaiF CoA transferase family protein n=1 Tax=unclassified Blastococcus TaxID=2619396 RepID=UPI001EF0B7E6|nr:MULTISPECIES: CaiB/BaiF CoA-transferase family protein [unclassified Blastococcus]MCF6509750.1 CoA transferase [Blastococcus sp. MG754426]MCF6514142.1 CoA transferase [Blastococcus sp. MG754427]MCF6734842.1 CoA transferase [Blastococcus sp. KM273129]
MGPLEGVRVVEFAGLGPGPFCGMLLADLGADVVRIDRKGSRGGLLGSLGATSLLDRGKRSIALDLKDPADLEVVRALVRRADVLLEGFRPGVMERLGLGPDDLLGENPALVYGRMTGWGQTGPLAHSAGHDIGYIALTGALGASGRPDEVPAPPMNLLGDFGGGGVFLALGALAALVRARATGEGQVVDAAIVDGTAVLTTMIHGMLDAGVWTDRRGRNLLDTGAPFYDVYRCADGQFVAVGALEEQFYAALLEGLGLTGDETLPRREDPRQWPALRERFTQAFASRTRAEWWSVFEGTDACVAPVWSLVEATEDRHNVERGVFVEVDGVRQPDVAPRFSRTPGAVGRVPRPGQHGEEIRAELGL